MKGYLVINHFLRTEKFEKLYEWLREAADRQGVELITKTNVEMMSCIGGREKPFFMDADFILFWDKDIKLAKLLEAMRLRVFNKASAIENCDDKALTHIVLAKAGIRMPKTFSVPMTFPSIGYTEYSFLDTIEKELGYPMVVKECFGSFGQQVYLCHNREEVLSRVSRQVIFQEFIEESFGRDIRIQIVGNKVVTAMYRYSENGDFRANISNGGKMKPYTPNEEQRELALACVQALELDFAGVDILFDKEDRPIICEVNSNAHFKNIYDCTGVNTADFIIEDIVQKITAEGGHI